MLTVSLAAKLLHSVIWRTWLPLKLSICCCCRPKRCLPAPSKRLGNGISKLKLHAGSWLAKTPPDEADSGMLTPSPVLIDNSHSFCTSYTSPNICRVAADPHASSTTAHDGPSAFTKLDLSTCENHSKALKLQDAEEIRCAADCLNDMVRRMALPIEFELVI